jgi:cell surface protein SprA
VQIGKGSEGLIFIDDFEGTRNAVDLRFPLVSWGLASTPGGNGLFPEAEVINDLQYNYNRAKLAWYNIEPVLQDRKNVNNPVRSYEDFTDPRIRQVRVTEIYPNKTPDLGQAQLVTFDLAFYPEEKGPYNFDSRTGSLGTNGRLTQPKSRWGGIMRGLDQVDFETGNVEFIEFWMQDPYLRNPSSTGGQLYFNLGNVSEDIMHDGKRFFENGISGANITALEDTNTVWGKVPGNPIQVTQAFSNDPADRPFQDAGFDGLINEVEQTKFGNYLTDLRNQFGAGSPTYLNAFNDPSSDDFRNYRDAVYDQSQTGILGRYKNINSPQGNSPVAAGNQEFVSAFTLYPDQEEFNRDNTLNELEEYFQYKVELVPDQLDEVGQNFITDVRTFTPSGGQQEKWYLFRIPIAEYQQKVGNIPDFKSIRFIRMFLTGFEDSVVLRFAKLELVRNQWRRLTYQLDTTGVYEQIPANSPTEFNQLAVNVEENSSRKPIPYKTPPDVVRQQQISNNNVNLLLNEQSLSMQICNLAKGDARGVIKTLNLDLRQYGKLKLYTHIESGGPTDDLRDNDMYAVIRLGNDLINNFYEVRIPLRKTPWGSTADADIWPTVNDLDLDLDNLVQLKTTRNNTVPATKYFKQTAGDGKEYAILGNPNLGEVRIFFLGVENRFRDVSCSEVWFNELRLGELNEKGGYAALGRVDFKLADLGTLYISGGIRTTGFGTIEQRVNERSREDLSQFDIATNLELGKLLPQKAGVSIPFYASLSQTVASPQYDPYDLDVTLKDKLQAAPAGSRDSIRSDAVDKRTIQTVNFTNVKKMNTTGKKQRLWSVENLDVSYSYYKEEQINPLVEKNSVVRHRGGLGYNYVGTPKFWEPFRPAIKSKSPWLALFRDFNLNPVPSLLSFRADVNRQFGAFRPRNVGGPKSVLPETFDKYFTFDRIYNARWDISKSINLDFSATNRSWVDEDSGRLSDNGKKNMWDNFWKGGRTISYQHTANLT